MRSQWMIALLISVLFALTWFFPLWTFKFQAPQYPMGLKIDIYLDGAKGDVFEIDVINHYIGMSKLELAAQNEKKFAPYALLAASLFAFSLPFRISRIKKILLCGPVLLAPLVFIIVFYYWLHMFGHNLDPKAAVLLAPFTPVILGQGIIGQFKTMAYPNLSFYFLFFAALCCGFGLKWDSSRKNRLE